MKNVSALWTMLSVLFFCANNQSATAQQLKLQLDFGLKTNASCTLVFADSNQNVLWIKVLEQAKLDTSISNPGKYLLSFQAADFVPLDTWVNCSGSLLDLGILHMIPISSTSVNIQIKKPIFENSINGTKINVAQSMLSKTINGAELVSKLPGISLSQNKLNYIGFGEVLVILNGKETNLDVVKSLPPSQIEYIEIQTNPNAKYDAKGKVLMIIQMKKIYTQGYSVSINNAFTVYVRKQHELRKYLHNAPNVQLDFRKKKWNFSTYYGNELGTNWAENNYSTIVRYPTEQYKTISYYTENNHSKSVHFYRAGISREIGKRANWSLQYDGFDHYFTLDVAQNGDYYAADNSLTLIRMVNAATTKTQNNAINSNFNFKLDTNAGNLFVAVQYNQFQNILADAIQEKFVYSNNTEKIFDRINSGKNKIVLSTAQADLSKNIAKLISETGVKFSYAENAGRIQFFSKSKNETAYLENLFTANQTLYKEKVVAMYENVKFKHMKWQIQAGVRVEFTDVNSYSYKLGRYFIDTSYVNLFPSTKIGYKINPNLNLQLNYARKINRPVYQDLDPFLWYLDSLTSITGNPNLKPEYIHQNEVKLFIKKITLRIQYNLSANTIWAVTRPGNSGKNSQVYVKQNIQHRITRICAMDVPVEKGNYASFTTVSVNYYTFKDTRADFLPGASKPMLYMYSNHSYSTKKLGSFECSGEYWGRSSDGYTNRKAYYYFSLGWSKTVLKEKVQVSLVANDIARTALIAGTRVLHTFTNTYAQRYATKYYRLTLTWNFSKLENYKYNNKSVNETEFNRIKQ